MPSQRRPPPPPPPGDDGPVPPPLPNRGGAAPLPTLLPNGGSAPPPLPNRNQHGGSGPIPPALPARPAQQPPGENQRARSMASRSYPNGNHFQDEYLLPTSNGVNDEEEEELYEEMNPVPDIRPPTPLRPQGNQAIDDEPEQTYELPEESTLVRPRAGLPLPSSSRKNRNSDTPDDGDDDLWSDSEFDNVDDLNGNNSGSDNDGNNLYLTPDGGGCSNEMMEDTYESPDTGDAGVGHFTKTPVNKPVVAPRDAPGGLVQKLRSEFASFAEKKKMFNQPQSANTSDNNKRKPPGHPEKATPIFNPPTPPKPTVNSRPDQISKEGALPHSKRSSPEFSKPLPPPNKPSVPSKPPTTEKPLLPRPVANVSLQPQNSSSNSPSALPPALPPNHPSTRNHRNEDNSSAGSSSSESGGGVSGGFLAELTKVISSVPSSKHAERSQVLRFATNV
ncbi:hypothetical protein PoB_000694300 [Plakobranchus ocellatus]|uniref:WH2 domain-containing protein n=1 Tax=Plakobranchus ocellatus TaxID=259542 RepID=A0AAV3YE97_9GAST|nr:hypothetical protein PoB_000694300 [Plakobranchus ocellatus]